MPRGRGYVYSGALGFVPRDERSQPGGSNPNRINLTGRRNRDLASFAGGYRERFQDATGGLDRLLLQQLMDPSAGAHRLLPFFQQAAEAGSVVPLREFGRLQAKTSANIAGRFGGNVSSEELRSLGAQRESFGDALARQLAMLGPQALGAAQTGTGQLLGYRGQVGGEALNLEAMLLDAILGQQKKSNVWGKLLGAGVGVGAGLLTGSPQVGLAAGQAFG